MPCWNAATDNVPCSNERRNSSICDRTFANGTDNASPSKALAGFSKGGYTGSYRRNEIAGFVHGQEYVINAKATRDNLPLLKAINSGVDMGSMMNNSSPNIRYGSISSKPMNLGFQQGELRVTNEAIYIAYQFGEKENNRFFRGK